MSENNNFMGSFFTAVFGGLVAAAIAVAAQYFINYRLIEEPKIELQRKGLEIEGQKQVQALIPYIEPSCAVSGIDSWTWRVVCTMKNTGAYSADVGIESISMALRSQYPKRTLYKEGQGFTVDYADDLKSFRSTPTSVADLEFYIVFDRKNAPQGVSNTDLMALIKFNYQTLQKVTGAVVSEFPEFEDIATDNSRRNPGLYVLLPALKAPDAGTQQQPSPPPVSQAASAASS